MLFLLCSLLINCDLPFLFNFLTFYIMWKACFDFARITTAVMDAEIVPSENFIQSISSILGGDEKELSMFRYFF